MSYLNLKLAASPSTEVSQAAAAALTSLTVEVLKKKRELTAVAVEYVKPADWFIGGEALENQKPGSFYLDIKVTDGTNTKDEKAAYVKRVFAAVEKILGPLNQASYVVIHDVRGDAWGYQGRTQEYRYISGKPM